VTNPKLRKLLLIHGLFKLPCGFLLYSGASEGISFFSSLNISSMLFYFYLSPNVIVLLYLDSFDFFRNLDPILPFPLMISLGSLGQMGDVDPTEMIDLETGRIPLKHASLNLADSDGCFRSWTGYAKGWRNWYYRVSTKNRGS
jgi:hypothetical protein